MQSHLLEFFSLGCCITWNFPVEEASCEVLIFILFYRWITIKTREARDLCFVWYTSCINVFYKTGPLRKKSKFHKATSLMYKLSLNSNLTINFIEL